LAGGRVFTGGTVFGGVVLGNSLVLGVVVGLADGVVVVAVGDLLVVRGGLPDGLTGTGTSVVTTTVLVDGTTRCLDDLDLPLMQLTARRRINSTTIAATTMMRILLFLGDIYISLIERTPNLSLRQASAHHSPDMLSPVSITLHVL
jgi:hypothetical protein